MSIATIPYAEEQIPVFEPHLPFRQQSPEYQASVRHHFGAMVAERTACQVCPEHGGPLVNGSCRCPREVIRAAAIMKWHRDQTWGTRQP
jgi:hypothetical protein